MRPLAPALLGALLTLARPAAAQPADDEAALGEACGQRDEALARVAAVVAQRRLTGRRVASADELAGLLREAGSASPWPRSLALVGPAGQPLPRDEVLRKIHTFAGKAPARLPHRCGVAVRSDERGQEVVAVVMAPVLARVEPLPRRVRTGAWATVDARLLVPASGAQVVVLGPSGLPRSIPASFHQGRVQARFAVDRPGRWAVQVVAGLAQGPQPAAELVVLGGEGDASAEVVPGESATGADDGATLLAMIDEARRTEQAPTLVVDPALTRLAQAQAAAMARAQWVAHDVGGGDPEQRALDAGLSWSWLGENVAHGGSLAQVHRALWSSPSHRKNLLTARFRRVGVGVVRDGDGGVWVAQLLLDP